MSGDQLVSCEYEKFWLCFDAVSGYSSVPSGDINLSVNSVQYSPRVCRCLEL